MPLEKLPENRHVSELTVVAKINELIDAYNGHYHMNIDSHVNTHAHGFATSTPKSHGPDFGT